MGRSPLLYQPGKPAFERLVQRWIDRSAAMVVDSRISQDLARSFAKDWIRTIHDSELLDFEIVERKVVFAGHLVCRTRVSNAIDSYEKLIRLAYQSNGEVCALSTDLTETVRVPSLIPDSETRICTQVESDADIKRFREYYEERLRVELEKSDSGERKSKLVNDLSPAVSTDTSAVDGEITDSVRLSVQFTLGNKFRYESAIELCRGKITKQPAVRSCELTFRQVPVDCLERCTATRKMVLRELLMKSEESGEYAIQDAFSTCEVSGKKLHSGELDVCCISGKKVCNSLLTTSGVSGRKALHEHIGVCDFTGAQVINDELMASSLSGRKFRSDQAVVLSDGESVAHESEATKCAYSSKWYPKADCLVSAVTNRPVYKGRVAYSEKSNRICDKSELCTCEITGARLLPDEVGQCSLFADFELAVRFDNLVFRRLVGSPCHGIPSENASQNEDRRY